MNAQVKPQNGIVEFKPKDLTEILALSDQLPDDFFTNPDYDKQIDKAIEASNNLVYSLDDAGEKAAKADATSINKYANQFNSFITSVFRKQTESVKEWSDAKKAKVKILLENRQRLLDQFEEKRIKRLGLIRDKLNDALLALWEEREVKPDFRDGDIEPMAKLSGTLTETDNLTKKANDFLAGIVNDNLARQNKIESRIMELENRCLRADINPPLSAVNLGNDLYGSDEEFDRKVINLIASEMTRKVEMEERIRKQLEADNKKKLDDALAGQQQAAVEAVRQEQPKTEPQQVTVQANAAAPSYPSSQGGNNAPASKAAITDDKKTVIITAQFQIKVRKNISAQAAADHLVKMYFSPALKEASVSCTGKDHV